MRAMPWSDLATQFCLELAFGVLLALAFVPKAPVGVLFYRLMGTAALVPMLIAVGMALGTGTRGWNDGAVLSTGLAIATYPVYSGPVRGRNWGLALGVALVGCAAAVAQVVADNVADLGVGGLALASASALATGAVAGSVGLAMVLGHWYLTVPNLDVGHLRRLNRVTVGSMLASCALLAVTCLAFGGLLNAGNAGHAPLFGATGLFYLGTRVTVGLLFPLAFAVMAASSLRFRNTRSATGILYASTVLVLIGTAVSVSLQDSYGIPL